MKILIQPLCLLISFIFFISLANAAPCGKARKPLQPVHQNYNKALRNHMKLDTTMAPQIEKVLAQIEESKMMVKKADYKILMRNLKDIFHTNKPLNTAVCKRCQAK